MLSLFIIFSFFAVSFANENETYYYPECTPTSSKIFSFPFKTPNFWIYEGFTSFDEINGGCDIDIHKDFLINNTKPHVIVNFYPAAKIIVKKPIALNDFNTLSLFGLTVRIADIVGFEVTAIHGFRNEFIVRTFFLEAQRFHMGLYLNNTLIDETTCNIELLDGYDISIFSNIGLTFFNLNPSFSHKLPVCPLIFRNAHIPNLSIDGMVNTALTKNFLQFYDLINERNVFCEPEFSFALLDNEQFLQSAY